MGWQLAFVLWFKLLMMSELSKLNVFTFLTPVFGITMGILFYRETMHNLKAIGVVIIIAGIFLVTYSENIDPITKPSAKTN